jgi:hypothetical protein
MLRVLARSPFLGYLIKPLAALLLRRCFNQWFGCSGRQHGCLISPVPPMGSIQSHCGTDAIVRVAARACTSARWLAHLIMLTAWLEGGIYICHLAHVRQSGPDGCKPVCCVGRVFQGCCQQTVLDTYFTMGTHWHA